jgi:hypothetical protein
MGHGSQRWDLSDHKSSQNQSWCIQIESHVEMLENRQ